MRSGELARLAGVSTDTLRHYESLGLLPEPRRTQANYRVYPPQAIARLRMIRNALAMGFSLKELHGIIQVREKEGAPCHEVRRLAQQKIEAMTVQVNELTSYRDHLKRVVREWDSRLQHNGRGQKAHLLEAMAEPPVRPRLRYPPVGNLTRRS
jgi:DNA-binding transcriptional MerR regulator